MFLDLDGVCGTPWSARKKNEPRKIINKAFEELMVKEKEVGDVSVLTTSSPFDRKIDDDKSEYILSC